MAEQEHMEPEAVAEDVEDLEVQPDEAEDVKGGTWGPTIVGPPPPPQ